MARRPTMAAGSRGVQRPGQLLRLPRGLREPGVPGARQNEALKAPIGDRSHAQGAQPAADTGLARQWPKRRRRLATTRSAIHRFRHHAMQSASGDGARDCFSQKRPGRVATLPSGHRLRTPNKKIDLPPSVILVGKNGQRDGEDIPIHMHVSIYASTCTHTHTHRHVDVHGDVTTKEATTKEAT